MLQVVVRGQARIRFSVIRRGLPTSVHGACLHIHQSAATVTATPPVTCWEAFPHPTGVWEAGPLFPPKPVQVSQWASTNDRARFATSSTSPGHLADRRQGVEYLPPAKIVF